MTINIKYVLSLWPQLYINTQGISGFVTCVMIVLYWALGIVQFMGL
jgi:hypothetical protein